MNGCYRDVLLVLIAFLVSTSSTLPSTLASSLDLEAIDQFVAAQFDQASLFRSMPELYIWLGSCGVLGALNGIVRIILLARRGHP